MLDSTNQKSKIRLSVIPCLNFAYLKSVVAVLQIIQMICSLSAYISLMMSPQCYYIDTLRPGRSDTILAQICSGPNIYTSRIFSVVDLLSFISSLFIFGTQITNCKISIWIVQYQHLVLFQLSSCFLLLLIISSILAADSYSSNASISAFNLGLIAFILMEVSVTCKWRHTAVEHNTGVFVQICESPNEHSNHFFLAITAITNTVNLIVYCVHIFSLMDAFSKVPWRIIIMIQTGASSVSLLLASSIMAGNTYGSKTAMAAVFFGFVAAVVYGFHFLWELVFRKTALVTADVTGDGHDNDVSNTEDEMDTGDENSADIPTLNSVTLRCHSPGLVAREATDTRTYFVEEKPNNTANQSLSSSASSFKSEGLELPNYTCNSSGSDDKRSWVITGSDHESKGMEDNLSTTAYTVETEST